jgi:hypothetical protein
MTTTTDILSALNTAAKPYFKAKFKPHDKPQKQHYILKERYKRKTPKSKKGKNKYAYHAINIYMKTGTIMTTSSPTEQNAIKLRKLTRTKFLTKLTNTYTQ